MAKKFIAAVDIGTTKVAAIVATRDSEGNVEVLGFGQAATKGVKRGSVFNVMEAAESVKKAVRKAEEASGQRIKEAYVNLSGQYMKTFTLKIERPIQNKVVSKADVEALFHDASEVSLPEEYVDHVVYHRTPQLFRVDDECDIISPVGTIGSVLSVDMKLFAAPASYGENLEMCFDNVGISIVKSIIDPLASSEVLLSDDEKEAGAVLLDLGGGSTKLAIYHKGVLCYCSMVPFGGDLITDDIVKGCTVLQKYAEPMKIKFGQAMGDTAPADKVVTIPGVSGRPPREISFKNLAYIIQGRMEDIIESVSFLLEKRGYMEKIGAGIVLTGGGSSLPNLTQLISLKTGLDVRRSAPRLKIIGLKEYQEPAYATLMGLLAIGFKDSGGFKIKSKPKPKIKSKPEPKSDQNINPGYNIPKVNFGFLGQLKNKITHGKEIVQQAIIPFFQDDENDINIQ